MRTVTELIFAVCVVAAVVLELWTRRDPLRVAPLGDVLDQVFAERVPRVALVLFWWWLGWHFLVAQTVDFP